MKFKHKIDLAEIKQLGTSAKDITKSLEIIESKVNLLSNKSESREVGFDLSILKDEIKETLSAVSNPKQNGFSGGLPDVVGYTRILIGKLQLIGRTRIGLNKQFCEVTF